MSGHTPGSWHVMQSTRYSYRVVENDKFLIADCRKTKHRTSEEAKANAYFIAAAPDMLKALESCVATIKTSDYVYPEDRDAIDAAEAAIAKAKGVDQ